MIRVGVVGIGFMGSQHFNIHRANKKARIVAISDVNPDRLAGKWGDIGGNIGEGTGRVDLGGIATYEKAEQLFADPNVDLVDITLPTHMHARNVVKALEAGKHVLCEKPMARNADECKLMLNAAAKARGMLMIAQCIRFWPEYVKLKEIVDSKKYGRVTTAHFTRVSPTPTWSWKGWLMKQQFSGATAMDLHIHDTDFIQYLFGMPRAVSSSAAAGPSNGFDYILTTFEYGKGMHVSAEGAWLYPPTFPFEMAFRVSLEGATVVYSSNPSVGFSVHTAEGKTLKPKLPNVTGWEAEIDYFLTCIAKGEKPAKCRPESAAQSVEIVQAEIRSADLRRKIRIAKR